MFVDDMKHSKIELSVRVSVQTCTYFRLISSNDGIWLYANIALALHRGCRLNKRLKALLYVIRKLCFCIDVP